MTGNCIERVLATAPDLCAIAILRLYALSPLTMTFHRLHVLPPASLRHGPCPEQPSPCPGFSEEEARAGRPCASPGRAEQGPASPLPDQIQFQSLMSLQRSRVSSLTPLLAGWVVPAPGAGRALGSSESGGGTERVKNVRANCS